MKHQKYEGAAPAAPVGSVPAPQQPHDYLENLNGDGDEAPVTEIPWYDAAQISSPNHHAGHHHHHHHHLHQAAAEAETTKKL